MKCDNPVGQTVSKMLPINFSSQKTVPYQFLAFYLVLYVNNSEIRISGNPVGQTVSKMSPIDSSSEKTVFCQFLTFYVVLYDNYSEI